MFDDYGFSACHATSLKVKFELAELQKLWFEIRRFSCQNHSWSNPKLNGVHNSVRKRILHYWIIRFLNASHHATVSTFRFWALAIFLDSEFLKFFSECRNDIFIHFSENNRSSRGMQLNCAMTVIMRMKNFIYVWRFWE